MHLAHYLGLLHRAQDALAGALLEVGEAHRDEVDIASISAQQAGICRERASSLHPFAERYSEEAPDEPERLHSTLFHGSRSGGLALLRDLQDLYLMAAECDVAWALVGQAAQGLRDEALSEVVSAGAAETSIQLLWLRGRMKQAAPQALIVG
ncbi:hypothetical protein JIG36_08955 [Actinoplanes sp. LDG1-06]|uniref:Uncharacterized protein n=1 Tax=Paractinoplanes ovalisporus TaxID=2810368 RepID=A0ABS2A7H4_9ACTN|nr:hypothetical protein [Actinoplanes ovalisporus]MBM2615680.1 hypothetical protein [Actinoplanes ovalisporus]